MNTGNEKERLDLDRKIVALVSFAILSSILLILIVNLSINTSSGIRGFVAGEGYWAKAQKESIIHLSHYIISEEANDFEDFQQVLRINLADKIAREELLKADFDYDVVYKALEVGNNHPDDIPDMINIFKRFQWTPQVGSAIEAWTNADEKIAELQQFADSIHSHIETGEANLQLKKEWLSRLVVLDHELTGLELRFSESMGNIARLVSSFLRWSTISISLFLISLGLWLTYRFFNSTKVWMKTLKESEEKFKNVLNNSRDVLYKMDLETHKYEYVSPALEDMLGYKPEEFSEGGAEFILSIMHPKDRERMSKIVDDYESTTNDKFLPVVEFRLKDSEGNWKWVSNVRTLVTDEDGKPEAIVGSVRDISTRKRQNKLIKKSLKEKEVLLQEIHHRVKNNLAIISSLLELQKEGVSEEVQEMLSSSQSRIKSIAKVHEKLYESTTLSDIALDTYITELTQEIEKAYNSKEKDIDIQIDVETVLVNIDEAIPIGLILNELINNAFKHAFKGLESGILKISLNKIEERLELVVENTGNQLDADFDPGQSTSLGMTLIQILAKRINGALEIDRGEKTRFKINFKLDDVAS